METLYQELFQAMSQFRKLKIGDMLPEMNQTDFFIMCTIQDNGKGGKMTISELAAKARVLPSAVSRTLKGLEDRGYVERYINKQDRRNTYVELTKEGDRAILEARNTMEEFGRDVMRRLKEDDIRQLISYLNNIYRVSEKEIEARKQKGRKEREHE